MKNDERWRPTKEQKALEATWKPTPVKRCGECGERVPCLCRLPSVTSKVRRDDELDPFGWMA